MQTLEQKQAAMRIRGSVYDRRHRQNLEPANVDSQAYWDGVLDAAGLGINQGTKHWLLYWGRSDTVGEAASRLAIEKQDGRKPLRNNTKRVRFVKQINNLQTSLTT